MAIDTDERRAPLPERLAAQMTKPGDQVQGSQAWT